MEKVIKIEPKTPEGKALEKFLAAKKEWAIDLEKKAKAHGQKPKPV